MDREVSSALTYQCIADLFFFMAPVHVKNVPAWQGLKHKGATMPERLCKTCFFWDVQQHSVYATDPRECRWRPPTLRTSEAAGVTFSAFPQTHEDAWCGQWQPRPQRRAGISIKRKQGKGARQ
jgi:hypothetical protein